MDFFDILGMEKTFDIENNQLEKKYFEKMKNSENHIVINEAYRTIKDDLKRAIYLLRINNYKIENPSSSFLHNIFNAFDTSNQDSLQEYIVLKEKIIKELKEAFNDEDYGIASIKTSELKYVCNLIEYIKKHGNI